MDTVKPDCASLLLDSIWDIIQSRADDQEQPDRLKSIIVKCKSKLSMTLWINIHGVDKKRHLPATCGADIGKGLIKDLLNYTINAHGASSFTPHPSAKIEFHINKLHFIAAFVPEDLSRLLLL
jgi:hypothetical protein